MTVVTLDQAIELAEKLPLEQQEMLVDILRKRKIEVRRREIAQDARESVSALHAGKLKSQTADEVIKELHRESDDILVDIGTHDEVY